MTEELKTLKDMEDEQREMQDYFCANLVRVLGFDPKDEILFKTPIRGEIIFTPKMLRAKAHRELDELHKIMPERGERRQSVFFAPTAYSWYSRGELRAVIQYIIWKNNLMEDDLK